MGCTGGWPPHSPSVRAGALASFHCCMYLAQGLLCNRYSVTTSQMSDLVTRVCTAAVTVCHILCYILYMQHLIPSAPLI